MYKFIFQYLEQYLHLHLDIDFIQSDLQKWENNEAIYHHHIISYHGGKWFDRLPGFIKLDQQLFKKRKNRFF